MTTKEYQIACDREIRKAEDVCGRGNPQAQLVGHLAGEAVRLRSLLQQMLDVAENCDETGYADGFGFVDLDKLHAEVRAAIGVHAEVIKAQKHAHETPLRLD